MNFFKKILYELMFDLKTVDWPPELDFNLQVSVTTQLHFFDHPAQEKKIVIVIIIVIITIIIVVVGFIINIFIIERCDIRQERLLLASTVSCLK